ncbi:TlpA family protein disulfide reductase [Pedobacter sp. PAMC26386]|nr:TlpA family protein disulfide reductase [Pedobacter sp. PAMC26386]
MKRITSSILWIAILILFAQVATKAQSSNTFIIKGIIDTVPKATYVATYLQKGNWVRDTIRLDSECRFKYIGKISEPTIFNLTIKNTFNPMFLGDSYVYTFWVEPGKSLSFEGKTGWLAKGTKGLVVGPKKFHLENSDLEIIDSDYKKSARKAYSAWDKNKDKRPDVTWKNIVDSLDTDFILHHPDNYYSMYLLYDKLKGSQPDYPFVEKYMSTLSARISNTYLRKEAAQRIKVNNLLGIGKIFPDFEQPDSLSKAVKLSSFRGKYVLVDFWASWCGPCRAENPNLITAYKKYAKRGFDIVAISLDKSRTDWLEAIHQDQLPWKHVSDLKGFDNTVAKSLFIHLIPESFLLDPNGVIIAKGLNGKELIEKLKSIFNN